MLGELSDSAESLDMGKNSPASLPFFSPRHLAASSQHCLEAASPASLPMIAGEESGSEGCQETLPAAFPLEFKQYHPDGHTDQSRYWICKIIHTITIMPFNVRQGMASLVDSQKGLRPLAWAIVSQLFGLGFGVVRRAMKWMKAIMARPTATDMVDLEEASTDDNAAASPRDHHFDALCNVVREAIAAAAEGSSNASFTRTLQRMRLAGGLVGNRYASRTFMWETTCIAALLVKEIIAFDILQTLPGLGICSDIAIGADPVAIGLSASARHDELCVICITCVQALTGARAI
jgi:hypothetical protein